MVLLNFEIYESLIEDLDDLAVLAERVHEPEISFETFEKKLKLEKKFTENPFFLKKEFKELLS